MKLGNQECYLEPQVAFGYQRGKLQLISIKKVIAFCGLPNRPQISHKLVTILVNNNGKHNLLSLCCYILEDNSRYF